MSAERWVDEEWADFVTSSYEIPVDAVVSMRSVTGIVSGERRYILKPFRGVFDRERMEVLGHALDRIRLDDVRVARFMMTKSETYTTFTRGRWIILQEWAAGRHTNMADEQERLALCREVGKLHRTHLSLPHNMTDRLRTSALGARYIRRARRFGEQVKALRVPEREMSRWLEHFNQRAQQSAWSLERSRSQALARERDFNHGTLCHRDLAPHNALYLSNHVTLIDFDLAGWDVRCYDLYQMINHAVFLHGWDERVIESLIQSYESVYPLCPDNVELLYYLLAFPALLVREVADGRKERRGLGRLNPRLAWAIDVERQREAWIKRLR